MPEMLTRVVARVYDLNRSSRKILSKEEGSDILNRECYYSSVLFLIRCDRKKGLLREAARVMATCHHRLCDNLSTKTRHVGEIRITAACGATT